MPGGGSRSLFTPEGGSLVCALALPGHRSSFGFPPANPLFCSVFFFLPEGKQRNVVLLIFYGLFEANVWLFVHCWSMCVLTQYFSFYRKAKESCVEQRNKNGVGLEPQNGEIAPRPSRHSAPPTTHPPKHNAESGCGVANLLPRADRVTTRTGCQSL